jgi:sugar O-acyltransferase (sialic acid O-acetyltransferase NeuD family)
MKHVVIFGAGGQGRLAYVCLSKDSPYKVVAFTVHEKYIHQEKLLGLDIVPFECIEEVYPPDKFALFVAMGYVRLNKARAEVYDECKRKGYELVSYISSKAVQWGEIEVGDNCFILEGTLIQPFTNIGNDVFIGSGSIIGHDVTIGDHCFLAPGVTIAGGVDIGPYTFIGANATFTNDITVGAENIIGAGAIILKDTAERGVYLTERTQAAPVTSAALSSYLGARKRRRES